MWCWALSEVHGQSASDAKEACNVQARAHGAMSDSSERATHLKLRFSATLVFSTYQLRPALSLIGSKTCQPATHTPRQLSAHGHKHAARVQVRVRAMRVEAGLTEGRVDERQPPLASRLPTPRSSCNERALGPMAAAFLPPRPPDERCDTRVVASGPANDTWKVAPGG